MSAQTPRGVVIRERVEVTRPAADPDGMPVAVRASDPCAGGAVAFAVVVGAGYGGGMPLTIGAPLEGTVDVSSPCGTASGALETGFRLVSHDEERARFTYTPEGEILRFPLAPAAALPTFSVTVDGQTLTQDDPLQFGCERYPGASCSRTPPAFVTAEVGIRIPVDGWATTYTHAWPDSVACGSATPLPVTMTKPDGSEGYVGPVLAQDFRMPGWQSPAQGALRYDGETAGRFFPRYGDTRAGAVSFVAPACDTMTESLTATIWVTGFPQGGLLEDQIRVTRTSVPPPNPCVPGSASRAVEGEASRVCGVDPPPPPPAPPVFNLTDQGGNPVGDPDGGSIAYVMVSKVRPDWLLDVPGTSGLPFNPPPRTEPLPETGPPLPEHYDRHTYRPEATGLPLDVDASAVRFQLEVFRGGAPTEIWDLGIEGGDGDLLTEYQAVCEVQGVNRQDCRSTLYVRFVSNARPANMSGEVRGCERPETGTCYDDEHLGTQTVRVELGDVVRWTLLVAGVPRSTEEYTVGALVADETAAPGVDPYDIARTVRVRFVGTQSLEVPMDPAGTVQQMNQMWAQAGLNLLPLPSLPDVPDLIDQFLEIDTQRDDVAQRAPTFPRAGTIRGRIGEGEWTSLAVGRNSPVHPAIETLIRMLGLSLETDVRVVTHREKARADRSVNHSILLSIWSGGRVSVQIQDVNTGVRIRNRNVVSSRMAQPDRGREGRTIAEHVMALEMHMIALRYGDDNITSVEIFTVSNDALNQLGRLRGYAYANRENPGVQALVNTVVLRAAAADGDDAPAPDALPREGGYPHTAGHEVGHVLFNSAFPGSGVGGHVDSSYTDNVMAAGPTVSGNQLGLGSRRRLWRSQQIDARTSQPSLLFPFVLSPVVPLQSLSEGVVSGLTTLVAPALVPVPALPERE